MFVDAVEELVRHGAYERAPESRWVALLRPPLWLIQVPFQLMRVRLKLALELRKLGVNRRGAPPAKPPGMRLADDD